MQKVVDTIKIEKLEGGAFNVVQGDRYSDTLSYDEMLGLVSALTIAKEPNCLRWMQTKEEHESFRKNLEKLAEDIPEVEFEKESNIIYNCNLSRIKKGDHVTLIRARSKAKYLTGGKVYEVLWRNIDSFRIRNDIGKTQLVPIGNKHQNWGI